MAATHDETTRLSLLALYRSAHTMRFDDLGHSWMAEDPDTAAAALRSFWKGLS
jgi:hypothetical protein